MLALIGRAEVRDWVDVIACHERLQPLAYLAWAASGKDPGFTPSGILDHARRSARYTQDEVGALAFAGPPPTAADLSRRWHDALSTADDIIATLPAREVGRAVFTTAAQLLTSGVAELERLLSDGGVLFHEGRIGGAWPLVKTRD